MQLIIISVTEHSGIYIDFHLHNCTDGVNFDFEEALQPNSAEARAYTRLFKETVALFHQEMPGSQVGVQSSSLH